MTPVQKISDIHRLVVRGKLTLNGSFHIGSGSASRQSDMALQRNAKGQVYIPGTTLAGLLRSVAEDLAPYVTGAEVCANRQQPCIACDLFGWTPGKGEAGKGQASRLIMLDALPVQDMPSVVEIRDHVGMDRQRGAAREGLFYNREVAPANTTFSFEFRVQEPGIEEVRLLMAVMHQWMVSGLRLGGRTTAGLGSAQLCELVWHGLNFLDDNQLLDYLLPPTKAPAWPEFLPPSSEIHPNALKAMLGQAPDSVSASGKVERYLPQRILVELELQAEEPLLVVGYTPKLAVHMDERTTDAAFVTRLKLGSRGELLDELFLPGSGFKGLLRTRAEKIVRTLDYYTGYPKQEDAWKEPLEAANKYAQHISACAITHAVASQGPNSRLNACFGGSRMKTAEEMDETSLYDHSCVTCRMFGNTALRGRLIVEDGRLLTAGKTKLFDHVAIDRFSGGAADAKKFDDRPLLPGERFSINLELQRPEPWMLGLFALLLKDLCDGDLHLGHATHRGYGKVKVWVKNSTALILPQSKLAVSLEKAGYQAGKSENGPFWQVSLKLEEVFTQNGMVVSATPVFAWLEACHQDFLTTHQEIQQLPVLGEVREVQ